MAKIFIKKGSQRSLYFTKKNFLKNFKIGIDKGGQPVYTIIIFLRGIEK